MRIIAGEFKGRKLETPPNYEIRPTTEMVKEALFSILINDIYGSTFLDLFSGTGAVGIEACSRGAEKVFLVDKSRESISIIKKNINKIGCQDRVTVLASDYKLALDRIKTDVDIVFADPPYDEGYNLEILESLSERDVLSDNGIVIIEHSKRADLPDEFGIFERYKYKKYGKKCLSFFRKKDSRL